MLSGHWFPPHVLCTCVAFVWCVLRADRLPPCTYTDASPGAGSLVGGEPSQSLGDGFARVGDPCNLDNIIIYS